MSPVIANRDRDCFSCRIVSGTGLVGIGCYLGYYARKNPTIPGKITISCLSLSFLYMGVARYGQMYPFDKSSLDSRQA